MYFLHLVLTCTPHYIVMVKGLLCVRNDLMYSVCNCVLFIINLSIITFCQLFKVYCLLLSGEIGHSAQ